MTVRPAFAHPSDPPAAYAAIPRFVALIRDELLSRDECLTALTAAAVDAGYRGDLSGLRTRCAWAINDLIDQQELDADRAARFRDAAKAAPPPSARKRA